MTHPRLTAYATIRQVNGIDGLHDALAHKLDGATDRLIDALPFPDHTRHDDMPRPTLADIAAGAELLVEQVRNLIADLPPDCPSLKSQAFAALQAVQTLAMFARLDAEAPDPVWLASREKAERRAEVERQTAAIEASFRRSRLDGLRWVKERGLRQPSPLARITRTEARIRAQEEHRDDHRNSSL